MEDVKKPQGREFAKDKNAFADSSRKPDKVGANKAGQKRSGANNPRDADMGGNKPGQGNDPFLDVSHGGSKNRTGQEEGYQRRDTYHQAERKGKTGKRRNREYGSREIKKDKYEKDVFDGDKGNVFTEELKPDGEDKRSKKLMKLEKDAEKAGERTAKAKRKLQKTEYRLERTFDEKTGQVRYVLATNKKNKPFRQNSMAKKLYYRTESEAKNFVHGKVSEHEKDNSGVEAAHKSEQRLEDAVSYVNRHHKTGYQRNRERAAKLEKKQFKKEVNFRYQKFLEENPEMSEKTLKKQLQKRFRKRKIQREYANAIRAARAGKAAKQTKEAAVKSGNIATKIAKKIQELAAKHGALIAGIAVVVLLLIMIMTSISSCGAMFSDGMGTIMGNSYQSLPAEVDETEVGMTKLEAELQLEINNIETDYPDYDEYNYNLGEIGHNGFTLISYLSAVYTDFTAAGVEAEVEALFDEMYELTLEPTEETRTRTVTDPDTGEESEEEYTVSILNVTLTVKPLEEVVAGKMNSEQTEVYQALNESKGLMQVFYSPLDLYWYNYILHGYGYMIDPETGAVKFNKGLDISVPEGTNVFAAMDGTVTTAGYDATFGNYVVIEDSNGYCTKYAHLESMTVSAGQTVKHGARIGKTGSTGSCTGSELHIECLYNGEYYNPLFYFEAGEPTLYGEGNAENGVIGDVTPPGGYSDEAVARLLDEADKYVGMPYVWGGSNPSTGFDCSGFVCYVFTNSRVANLPRTTAQGIYNQCARVDPSEAKAGDIIFFTGTYNSGNPVTHVGIYCGDGVMVHAGDPIKYARINTSYWQSHFYAFGRLR